MSEWSFEGTTLRQELLGLEMTVEERLRWLDRTFLEAVALRRAAAGDSEPLWIKPESPDSEPDTADGRPAERD